MCYQRNICLKIRCPYSIWMRNCSFSSLSLSWPNFVFKKINLWQMLVGSLYWKVMELGHLGIIKSTVQLPVLKHLLQKICILHIHWFNKLFFSSALCKPFMMKFCVAECVRKMKELVNEKCSKKESKKKKLQRSQINKKNRALDSCSGDLQDLTTVRTLYFSSASLYWPEMTFWVLTVCLWNLSWL